MWEPALERAFGGPKGVDAGAMARVKRASTRPRRIPLMFTKGSWLRKKRSTLAGRGPAYMPRRHPVESSLEWDLCNVAAEGLRDDAPERYTMLRYEDFVREPRPAVERILRLVGEEPRSMPFVSERGVELRGPNHNVGGNPSRFRTGVVELKPDAEWDTATKDRDRRLVTALTLPFLARFGYGARVKS